MYAYTDNLWLILVALNELNVISTCVISLSHSDVGKSGYVVANYTFTWFLNI